MAKIVAGVALIAAAIIFSPLTPIAFFGYGLLAGEAVALGSIGASMLISGIAQAVQGTAQIQGQSQTVSVKQPAGYRQVCYGQVRISGNIVYESSTNGNSDVNQIIVWHSGGGEVPQLAGIDAVYLDGRQVIPNVGACDSSDHVDDNGNTYNFKGLVTLEHSVGGVAGHYAASLGGVDSKWDSSCTLNGIAFTFLKFTLDSTVFQGMPGVKANVRGKHVFDPRIGGVGYTNCAALVIADVLMSNDYGLAIDHDDMDWDYIAGQANICDEQVVLASGDGDTEARYTINGFFSTAEDPGSLLQAMLDSIGGRIGMENGKWRVYVGAYYGTGLVFFDSNIINTSVKWSPNRSRRDRINAIRATMVSPKFPYSLITNSESTPIEIGTQDVKTDDVFSGQWQVTDAPEYAADPLHGYSDGDVYLAADGVKMYADLNLRFCTSVGQAQRVMKQKLLRNRFGGTGTLTMDMSAYQLVAGDVFELTFNPLSFTEKLLEVQSIRFVPGSDQSGSGDNTAPAIYCELQVNESDPSIFEFSPSEELGIENTASPVIGNAWDVNPPNNLVMESGIDSAIVDSAGTGTTVPRIHVLWDAPEDPFTVNGGGSVELQWQKNGDSTWNSTGLMDPTVTHYFIVGVVCSQAYNVQMRAVRASGASSAWVSAGPHTVSILTSNFSYENIDGLGALAVKNSVAIGTGDVTGAGSLASRNNVDFASGSDVLNRTADNIHYTAGLTVDQLRPAEIGAEPTTGKSLTILTDRNLDNISDSGTYARIKGSQLTSGVVHGKVSGTNLVPNPGWEKNDVGTTIGAALGGGANCCDDWIVRTNSACFTSVVIGGGGGRSGQNCLLIRVAPGVAVNPGDECRVTSTLLPIIGGAKVYISGYMRLTVSIPMQAGAAIIQRMGALYFDINGTQIGEDDGAQIASTATGGFVTYGFTKVEYTGTVPSGASYIAFECGGFYTGSPTVTDASGLWGDMCFDDVELRETYTTSRILSPQGSILPNQAPIVNYTTTNSAVTFVIPSQGLLRADSTTLSVTPISFSVTGLSAGTGYYFYMGIGLDGNLGYKGASTTPNAVMAMQCALDGGLAIEPIHVTTLAGAGTGSGTGGGGDRCPEAAELVEIEGKGQIPAGEVKQGDRIKGKSFKTDEDVYRRVIQASAVSCTAWRMIDEHRVSPCEPVYLNDQWVPAYRVEGSTFDTLLGSKVAITVESDEYRESNYYLVSGTPLLIHNLGFNPC